MIKKKPSKPPTDRQQLILQAEQVANRIRAVTAARLRLAGHTVEQIMEQLNFETPAAVHLAISNIIKQFPVENKADLRQLENNRLEALLKAVWPLAVGDNDQHLINLSAMDRVLKIMERRARLFSLDGDQAQPSQPQPPAPKPAAEFNDADRARIIKDLLSKAEGRKTALDKNENQPLQDELKVM